MKKIFEFARILTDDGVLAASRSARAYVRSFYRSTLFPRFPRFVRTESFTAAGYSAVFEVGEHAGKPRSDFDNERENLEQFLTEIKNDDVIFDIGANIGLYSCFAAQKVNRGNIYAFEPFDPNAEQLEKNLQYGQRTNVDILNIALSDVNGVKGFSSPANSKTGLRTGSISDRSQDSSSDIQVRRGDDLVIEGKIEQPDVVKIDVEGAEAAVCRGLEHTLSSDRCRIVFCEIHPEGHHPESSSIKDFGMSPDELIEFLEDIGFNIRSKHKRGSQIQVTMEK